MNIIPIQAIRIISTIEQYNALVSRLHKDRLDYENYKTLEPDEEKEKIAKQKVIYDYEQIGNFLNTYV